MRKEIITYTDYDGNQHTEDFYFNLNQPELAKFNFKGWGFDGGLSTVFEKIQKEHNNGLMIDFIERLVIESYGERDGARFMKVDENGRSLAQLHFVPTEAYPVLFDKLSNEPDGLTNFIKDIVPKNIAKDIEAALNKNNDNTSSKVLPGPGAENK